MVETAAPSQLRPRRTALNEATIWRWWKRREAVRDGPDDGALNEATIWRWWKLRTERMSKTVFGLPQ